MNGRSFGAFVAGFGTGYKFVSDEQQRAAREKREQERYEREKQQAEREAAWQKGREEIMQRFTQEPIFTEDASGNLTQVGTRPKQRTLKDNLQLIEEMAAHDFRYGKLGLVDFTRQQRLAKELRSEGLLDAHRAFVETGDIRSAAQKFNEVGDKKIKIDSLRAIEDKHPIFGSYVRYEGELEGGGKFQYDPIKASVIAGGAKGYLESLEKGQKAKLDQAEADRKAKKDQEDARLKDRELAVKEREVAVKEDELRFVKKVRADAYAASKGTGQFQFKPVDQARIASQVAARMQRVDPVSNKEVDHDATPDAIALAGEIYRKTKGEIGLDQAVGLVARPGLWLSKEEAEKMAREDLKKMKRRGLFGGGDVVLSEGKGGDKTVKPEEYIKRRTQEYLDRNREEVRKRAFRLAGISEPAAARGLPPSSATKALSPAAKAVLDAALGK